MFTYNLFRNWYLWKGDYISNRHLNDRLIKSKLKVTIKDHYISFPVGKTLPFAPVLLTCMRFYHHPVDLPKCRQEVTWAGRSGVWLSTSLYVLFLVISHQLCSETFTDLNKAPTVTCKTMRVGFWVMASDKDEWGVYTPAERERERERLTSWCRSAECAGSV